MRKVRYGSARLLFAALVAHAGPGFAQPAAETKPNAPVVADAGCASKDVTACGRLKFEAGTRAFEAADFTMAVRLFEEALALRPHPVIRYNLALSLLRTSAPKRACDELRLVQNDAAADAALRERAGRDLGAASQLLARISFSLSDESRERIELDGSLLAPGIREVELAPGTHHVRVSSAGAVVLDQELELAARERVELRVGERSRRIDVVVVSDENARATEVAPEHEPPAAVPRHRLGPGWFYLALGATAALSGAAVWSGLDTRSALSDYDRELPNLTQAQADERVSEGHGRELRTNLLIGGAVLSAVGSAALGIWFIDFAGPDTRASLEPGRVALRLRF